MRNITITTLVAYVFYNMYLLSKVYFGSGVMSLSLLEEKELMKINEPVILKKLGFSKKFSRNVTYARKSVLSIGLIKPSIVVLTLVIKQYVGDKRMKISLAIIININEEIAFL